MRRAVDDADSVASQPGCTTAQRHDGEIEEEFPEKFAVVGDYMPDGFVRQQLFPFRGSSKPMQTGE